MEVTWNKEREKCKENSELEKEKHSSEKDKWKEEVHRLEKVISLLESEIQRLKNCIDSVGEERKSVEGRLSVERQTFMEKYESEKKRAGTLQAELQQKSSTLEEKSKEWKQQADEMVNKHIEEQDILKKEAKTLKEDYERQIKELKEEAAMGREVYERKLIQLELTYKNEITTVRYERETHFREVTSKEIEKMRKELENEKGDFQQTLLAEKKQLIDEYNLRIKEENGKLDKIEEKYRAEVDSLTRTKYELQNKLFDLEREMERAKEQMTYSFAEERRKLECEFETQIREMKEKHRVDLINRWEEDMQNMEAKFKTDRQEFEQQIQLEYKAAMTAKVSSKEKQLQQSLFILEQEFNTKKDKFMDTERSLKMENELLMRDKHTLLEQNKKDKEELSKKMEHEKELIQVTVDALSRDMSKMREDKNFLVDSFSREKKEVERKHDTEMTELRERLERNKQELVTRLREENNQSIEAIQRSREATITALRDKLAKSEKKVNEMEGNFKREKGKLEHQFEHEKMELELRNQKVTQEVKIILEQELSKRSQEETKIRENTMSSLRSEIAELRGSKSRLETALSEQRMLAFQLQRDINLLKGGTLVSTPRNADLSFLERELQELKRKNESLKMATKEAQFFNNELLKWDSGKNCHVLKAAQELKYMASPGKPFEIQVSER